MKRFVLALGLVAAALAVGQNGPLLASKTFTYSCPTDGGSCTGSAPSAATDGVDLRDAVGYTVGVSIPALPDAGQAALSGGGSLLCYYRGATDSTGVHGSSVTRQWARCKTSLDITSIAGGQTAYFEPNYAVGVGAGRVMYVPSAVTHDGGGIASGVMDVDVTLEVQRAARPTR
jgi:hypothetical protein